MNLTLNPFDKGKKPEVVEDVKVETENLEEVVKGYDMLYEVQKQASRKFEGADLFLPYACIWLDTVHKIPALTPIEIFSLSHILKDKKEVEGERAYFLSHCMQKSHDKKGSTHFTIVVPDHAIYYGINLKHCVVRMIGKTFLNPGNHSHSSKFFIEGEVKGYNLQQTGCLFYVLGDCSPFVKGNHLAFAGFMFSHDKQPWRGTKITDEEYWRLLNDEFSTKSV